MTAIQAIAERKVSTGPRKRSQARNLKAKKTGMAVTTTRLKVSLFESRPTITDKRPQRMAQLLAHGPDAVSARYSDKRACAAQNSASWFGLSDQPRNRSQYQGSAPRKL